MECSSLGSLTNLRNLRKNNTAFLNSGVWNALRWLPCKSQKSQKNMVFLISGVWNALRWIPYKSQKFKKIITFLISVIEYPPPDSLSNIRNLRKTTQRFWDLVYGMLFAGSLSNLRSFRNLRKKHNVFDICNRVSVAGFAFKSQKSREILEKHHAFEIWCMECYSLGPYKI